MNESQNADKIFNIEKVDKGNFGTEITSSENVVTGTVTAGGNIDIGDKTTIYQTIHGEIKINRFLTGAPFSTTYFIGRDKDLKQIENDFLKHNLVLLSGEGGLGKTSLAARFWLDNEKDYAHAAWVSAENGIANAIIGLKDNLHVAFDPRDTQAQQIERIVEAIVNLNPTCLFVFDNADDHADFTKHYTTLCRLPNCKILVTTRVKSVSDAHVYNIKPLGETEAVQLFVHHYQKHNAIDNALLHQVLEAVGYNTLVIELLAKNLTEFNKLRPTFSLQNLVDDLSKGLFAAKTKAVDVTYHQKTLHKEKPENIIAAMYDLADLNDTEKYILSNFAVLPTENIPLDILTELLKPENTDTFDDALINLQEKGWLNYRSAEIDFKISPVIQSIVQLKNKTALWSDCETLIDTLIDKLDSDIIHENNYAQATIFTRYSENILLHFIEPHYSLSILSERIGMYFTTFGNLDRAIFYYEKCRNISKQLRELEPRNSWNKNELASSYEKLGHTHAQLGNLDKALAFYEQRTELGKQLFEDFPNNFKFKNGLATSYSKLGDVHTALGNLNKALKYYEDQRVLFEQLYEDFPNNVDYKNNLAISYEKLGNTQATLGNLKKASKYYEQSNELGKQLFDNFPNNVEYKNGLAISYEKLGNTQVILGNLDKALKFYIDYNNLEKKLFEDFPNNVGFKNSLAISYQHLGNTHAELSNINKALKYYEEYNLLEKELHEAFPNNVNFKNSLALSFCYLGQFYEKKKKDNEKAKNYYLKAEKIYIELFATWQDVRYKGNLTLVQKRLAALG